MSTKPDNIIIGDLLASEEDLGILPEETSVRLTRDELWLPTILVNAGIFKSTSDVRRADKDRQKSKKITDPLSKSLWRKLDRPEFTHFKIGKTIFWLAVGE